MKRFIVFGIILTSLLSFAPSFLFAAGNEIVLGLAMPYTGYEFWADVQRGAEETAASIPGVKLTVTVSNANPTEQISQIESFIASKVDAILLPPSDPTALVPAVKEANDQGIPVIGVDTAVVDGNIISLVSSNNLTVGKLAGQYIVDRLKGKGSIIIIGWQRHTSTRERADGLKAVLKKYPGIKILDEIEGKLLPDTFSQAENVLTSYPKFDALFGVSDNMTLPFWKTAKNMNRNKGIFFVSVNATSEELDAIQEQSGYAATVAQQPYQMGKLAVETAIKVVKKQAVAKFTEVPVILVNIDNLSQFKK